MSANRYYFSDFIEDKTLRIVAVSAKDMLQQIDDIVKIYKTNNELLYGNSPKQVLFLMKQNNKPLYSSPPSPSSSKPSCFDISNPGPSTPISRNSGIPIFRRILLSNSSLDDAESKKSNSGTMETSTPVRDQAVKKAEAILNLTVDETVKVNEQFTSPVDSSKSPEAANQNSPFYAKRVTLAKSLNMDDEEVGSPAKVSSNNEEDSKESPRSAELTRITGSLTVEEKNNSLVLTRTDGAMNGSNQGPPRSIEVIRQTSDLVLGYKDSRSLVVDEQLDANTDSIESGTKSRRSRSIDSINKHSIDPVDETFKLPKSMKVKKESPSNARSAKKVLFGEDQTAANTDSCMPGEKYGKSDNADSGDKESVNLAEEMVKITNPIESTDETPSPVKRSKMGRISNVEIHEFSSPTEKVQLTNSSLEGTDISVSHVQIDKMNAGLNDESQETVVDERKRKSPTPKRTNATTFRSMPRVIQSAREAEMVIEVPCDSEDNPSPTNLCISLTVNSPLKKSPVMSESNADDSPKTVKRFLSPPERAISGDSSLNVSRESSLCSDDDNVFTDNKPSDTSSNIETSTGVQSSKSESSVPNNESEYFEFKQMVLKFNTLYNLRHQVVQTIFNALLYFQNNVGFLNIYARNVGFTVNAISSLYKLSSEELTETVSEANALVTKLMKKLTSWKIDIDEDVNTWQKYFQQIVKLKTQYGPFMSSDDKPLMTIKTLQVYEHELKAIWRRMDDMIVMGDARRSLFSHTKYDFEKLIKVFVKCLIIVGILHPR